MAERALDVARDRGIARARDFDEAGIPRVYLQRLCQRGSLVKLGRGLYQVADFEDFHFAHEFAKTARRVPHGVICLVSALLFHELTTQLPRAIWLMIDHKARKPQIGPRPYVIVRASGAAFDIGRISERIEGVEVTLTDPAKTVVDCFKYRKHVGIDIAIEALRDALNMRKTTPGEIWRYAEICRVGSIVRPYLEAMITGI